MANTFLTPDVIAAKALATLYENLTMLPLVYTDVSSDFSRSKVGSVVNVRKPATFTANEFDRASGISIQNATATNPLFTVLYNGNVGIGTVTPVYPLSVYRAAGEGTFNFESGADGAVVQNRLAGLDSDSQNQVWATGMNITDGRAGFEVYDYTDGSARMYISTGTGHVGIGTNSPTAPLHVSADVFRVEVSSTIGASGTPCNVGDIRWDIDYIYVCVEADTWKRAALTTWP